MADAASPQAADVPEKHNERSEKRSKHSSRDKERSSKDDHKTRSAKEHKHKHKSRERDRARGDREKRSNGDKNDTESSRDRDRHRRPRHDKAEPSGRVDAEPGELVTDAPSQRAGSVDRDAADGARAEAADFLRNEEAPPPQSLPPPPQSLPPLSASAGPSDAELGLPPLAGDVGPSGGARDLPSDFTPQTNDAGGEVSMSIEETNRCYQERTQRSPSSCCACFGSHVRIGNNISAETTAQTLVCQVRRRVSVTQYRRAHGLFWCVCLLERVERWKHEL